MLCKVLADSGMSSASLIKKRHQIDVELGMAGYKQQSEGYYSQLRNAQNCAFRKNMIRE